VPIPPGPIPPSPLPVVIDTDPGIDDLLALLLALASPELDVRGITVTYGNTTVEHAHRNAVAILRFAGRRVPLGISARRPLHRPLAVARETHADSGLGYAAVPAAGTVLDYVRPLERVLADCPEPVALVTLGPLTGLALALRREPALVKAKVRRHIAMVGALDATGNTTKYSEFNAWCDPEALAHVLDAQLPTELVGLDVTRSFVLSRADVARLGESDDPKARWLHDALRFYVEFHKTYEDLDGCVINDVLPVAALIDPGALQFKPVRLTVGLNDGDNRGRTRAAADGRDALFAAEPAVPRIRTLLVDRVLPWLGAMAGASR
jgi:inosine-uridine nucleoside N-ribohydrolase